ncbi:MAG TPA: oligosaccharide flippase family protein, partial [Gemmatimonadales bacterium]|nr:oligosaccharide flippase family protein [Gemmatimonadales bacterium]
MKRLGRDTMIYGMTTVISRLVSLIMLPVYTRLLTPADYGVMSLLDNTIDVATILFTMGALSGTTRYYFKAETEQERLTLVGTAFSRLIVSSMIGTLVLLLGAPLIWQYFLHGAGSPGLIRIAALTFFLGDLSPVALLLLQIRQRAGLLSVIGIARLVMQLGLNIVLVVHFRMGVAGVLLSSMITTGVIGVTGVVFYLRIVGLRFDRAVGKQLGRFGRPYQLSGAASFILTFGDRFFLQALAGAAVVGLYGLAYQFGFLLTQLGVAPFMRAWGPIR